MAAVGARISHGDAVLDFLDRTDLDRVRQAGVVTPDHTIRIKNWPLVLPHPEPGKLDDFARTTHEAVAVFARTIAKISRATTSVSAESKRDSIRSPASSWCLDSAFSALAQANASAVIADIADEWIAVVDAAERIGRFESISEADMFDCEYWPLEQKKLGARKEPPLAGQIAAITGAAGAIGAATAKAFAAAGAEVALLDVNLAAASDQRKRSARRRFRSNAT